MSSNFWEEFFYLNQLDTEMISAAMGDNVRRKPCLGPLAVVKRTTGPSIANLLDIRAVLLFFPAWTIVQ